MLPFAVVGSLSDCNRRKDSCYMQAYAIVQPLKFLLSVFFPSSIRRITNNSQNVLSRNRRRILSILLLTVSKKNFADDIVTL